MDESIGVSFSIRDRAIFLSNVHGKAVGEIIKTATGAELHLFLNSGWFVRHLEVDCADIGELPCVGALSEKIANDGVNIDFEFFKRDECAILIVDGGPSHVLVSLVWKDAFRCDFKQLPELPLFWLRVLHGAYGPCSDFECSVKALSKSVKGSFENMHGQ